MMMYNQHRTICDNGNNCIEQRFESTVTYIDAGACLYFFGITYYSIFFVNLQYVIVVYVIIHLSIILRCSLVNIIINRSIRLEILVA